MPQTKFTFPIGKPAGSSFPAFAEHLKSVITAGENDFGPENINAAYTFAATASDDDKTIIALWDGKYSITGGVITSEAFPNAYLQLLRETYDEDIPAPKKVIYGPVDIPDKVVEFSAGEQIGKLKGNVFFIRFFDQNDFIINANSCLNLLHNRNLFESDQTTGFPFFRNNANDKPDLLFNETLAATGIHLKIKGGSFARSIYNPPAVIPAELFSFLSNDPIEISVLNAGAGSIRIEIEDITDKMYRTTNANPISKNLAAFTFIPQNHLKSKHLKYLSTNGKRKTGKPLIYTIKIFSGTNLICQTKIQQDLKDTVRQEYLFHSKPFQLSFNLDIPARKALIRNNISSEYINCNQYNDHNNYGTLEDALLLNASETLHVAEFMRRQFHDELRKLIDAGFPNIPREICTTDLNINSSWRNPERNEVVEGKQASNHQFGRAQDMASFHYKKSAVANLENIAIQTALFQAGHVFAERLIALNGAAICTNVEILLERNATLFLKYTINSSGVISLQKQQGNLNSAGVPSGGTDAAVISGAASLASHVHIGWKSTTSHPLILPDIPAYDQFDIESLPLKNIILVPSEHKSVPVANQFPFPHIARTIKECLDNSDDGIETIILDVANPLDVLESMGAYAYLYRINNFFMLGHANENGLFVTNTSQVIKDLNLAKRIKILSGKDPAFNNDGSLKKDIFGPDAISQFMLNEFRISNILYLPGEIIRRVRDHFKDVKNIFILGCNNTKLPVGNNINFCKELAGLLNKPVYGAGYFSKTFDNTDQKWQEKNISRLEPFTNGSKYVLAPDSPAAEQFVNNLLGNGTNELPVLAADLLDYYKNSLELVFFDPVKDARAVSFEIVETIDV